MRIEETRTLCNPFNFWKPNQRNKGLLCFYLIMSFRVLLLWGCFVAVIKKELGESETKLKISENNIMKEEYIKCLQSVASAKMMKTKYNAV